jgi:hypothetical protein
LGGFKRSRSHIKGVSHSSREGALKSRSRVASLKTYLEQRPRSFVYSSHSLSTGSLQDLQRPHLHVVHQNPSTGRLCWLGRYGLSSAEIPHEIGKSDHKLVSPPIAFARGGDIPGPVRHVTLRCPPGVPSLQAGGQIAAARASRCCTLPNVLAVLDITHTERAYVSAGQELSGSYLGRTSSLDHTSLYSKAFMKIHVRTIWKFHEISFLQEAFWKFRQVWMAYSMDDMAMIRPAYCTYV